MKKYNVMIEEENMLGTGSSAPVGGFVSVLVEAENPEEAGKVAITKITKQNQERFGDMHNPKNPPIYKVIEINEMA